MEEPIIHYFSPYSTEKNIGRAYNQACHLVTNPDHWICLTDGDALFLTPNYGHIIAQIVAMHPDTGLFSAMTNRVKNHLQLIDGTMSEDADVRYHRHEAMRLQESQGLKCKVAKSPLSGVMMLFKKSTWELVGGFSEGNPQDEYVQSPMLGIDNHFCQQILDKGLTLRVMRGIYLFHYYRFCEGAHSKDHLK